MVLGELARNEIIPLIIENLNKVDNAGFQLIVDYIDSTASSDHKTQLKEKPRLLGKDHVNRCKYCYSTNIDLAPKYDITIFEIRESEEGYCVDGYCQCDNCGMLIPLLYQIPLDVSGLRCPLCKRANLDVILRQTKKKVGGYTFTVDLNCKSRNCCWKRTIKKGARKVTESLGLIRRLKVTPTGFEVETYDKTSRARPRGRPLPEDIAPEKIPRRKSKN